MRRTPINPADAKPGDLVVTADGERMRVSGVRRFSDDNVIVHGTTVTGRVGKAQSTHSSITRLD